MQWMYFDSLESLKEEGCNESAEQYQPQNSRYDAQIAVFGQDFQKKMSSSKYFVVSTFLFFSKQYKIQVVKVLSMKKSLGMLFLT